MTDKSKHYVDNEAFFEEMIIMIVSYFVIYSIKRI